MKTQRASSLKRGFTLMELMVAMAITTIIVTVLVSITSIAIDTWNRSRSELRAARQAKAMVDTMARDFEALVTRSGNENEWLSAISQQTPPGERLKSTNAVNLIFFSGSTDRYNGEIGTTTDKGGDVSCVGYRLDYKDPIDQSGNTFQTFVLNRVLVNPDDTFRDLLGKTDLTTAFQPYASKLDDVENFVCENVFQFTITFQIEVVQGTGAAAKVVTVPVTVGQRNSGQVANSFSILGTGVDTSASPSGVTADELRSGRVKAVGVSLTVLSDAGIDQLRNRPFSGNQAAEFMAKHSYQYSKLIKLPGM
jgi:prepilin-type N-terminal cleavage/methylation domain-containing protein